MLIEKLRLDLKQAMKDKNDVKKYVVRTLIAECDDFIKTNKRDMTTDEEIARIRRIVKQTNESLEAFKLGGRSDLVIECSEQLMVLDTYLPKQFNEEEVMVIIQERIITDDIDVSNKGEMMKKLMPMFSDQSDRGMINRAISKFIIK